MPFSGSSLRLDKTLFQLQKKNVNAIKLDNIKTVKSCMVGDGNHWTVSELTSLPCIARTLM